TSEIPAASTRGPVSFEYSCPVSPKAANVRLKLRVILRRSGLPSELLPGSVERYDNVSVSETTMSVRRHEMSVGRLSCKALRLDSDEAVKRRPMATRNGSARWTGDLRTGPGELAVGEDVWTSAYSGPIPLRWCLARVRRQRRNQSRGAARR